MGNKNVKKFLCHGLVLAMVCSMTAGATVSDAAKAKKAKLAKKSLTIVKGASKKIKIKNKKKKAKYTFKASKKKIVKVYSSGKVKALKVGKVKVTVKEIYKKKKRTLGKVTVKVTKKFDGNQTDSNKSTPTPPNTDNANVTPTPSTTNGTGGNTNSSTPTATPTATPTPVPTEAVIYKNYFEDGDTNGFNGRGGSIEISNSENHTDGGKNSLLCTGRSANWHGTSMDITKLVEVGSAYKFSAWVKQDSGSAQDIAMKTQYNDLDGNTQYKSVIPGVTDGKTCASGQWVELSGEYTIPANDGGISLYFECPTSDSIDFLVDDVVIIGKPVNNDDKTFSATAEQSAQMAQAGLYSAGNNARLKNVIQKARDGQDVTLAYIGGSITEGALASPNSKCYAQVSATAFADTYGKDGGSNVHFINAGMSGTPSDIGVIRYKRDVLDRLPSGSTYPDILFIEFAVNDSGCETAGGAYEGLIREALKSGSAVVLIFSVFKPLNRVCENDYRKYGQHYDLPMISMGDAIKDFYKLKGFNDWYFGDNLHPNNKGYQLMSDCIMKLMDTVDKEAAEADNITDIDAMAPKKTSAYQGIKMIDSTTEVGADAAITSIEAGGFNEKDNATCTFQYEYNGQKSAPWFPNNWMHTKSSGSDSLKVKVNCKTLMIMYKISNSKTFGTADLYIDGVKKTTLDSYSKDGWNYGKVYLALTEDTAADHDIELKMADGNDTKSFTLMAIGYK